MYNALKNGLIWGLYVTTAFGWLSVTHPDIEMEDLGPVVDTRHIERKAKYNQCTIKSVLTRKVKGSKDSKPTLDDFINVGEREEVWYMHMPIKLYFDRPIRLAGQLSNGFNVYILSTKLSCHRHPSPS